MTMDKIDDYATVRTWLASARIAEPGPKVELLREFCERLERNPDEMIEDCLRLVQEGQFKLKGKTRRRYVEQIEEFEGGVEGRRRGNVIRSFFIHNGIPIQPPIIK
jgi:hypothetical protein